MKNFIVLFGGKAGMMIVYNSISFLLYILTILFVFCLILEYELKITKRQFIISVLVFTTIAGGLTLIVNAKLLILFNVFLTLIFLMVYRKNKKLSVFGIFIIINLCISQLEISLDIIFYIIIFITTKMQINIWIVDITVSLFLFICVAFITMRLWKDMEQVRTVRINHRNWFVIIEIIIFIINLILLSAEYKLATVTQNDNETIFNAIIFSLIFLFFVFFSFIVYYLLISHERQKELIELNERYLKQLNLYCDNLKSKNNDLRKLKHDTRQHLYTIRVLLESKKIQEAEKYIDEFFQKIEMITPVSTSGNIIIDSIIEQYLPTATAYNVTIRLNGRFPDNITVSDYALCTIFYNLLVNALEECRKMVGNKEIVIGISAYGRYINISITNPLYAPKKDFHSSTKPDKENHGYGLKNVKQCVEENHGDLKIIFSNTQCKVDVILEGMLKSS